MRLSLLREEGSALVEDVRDWRLCWERPNEDLLSLGVKSKNEVAEAMVRRCWCRGEGE